MNANNPIQDFMKATERVVSTVTSSALDFVYPPRCFLCNEEIDSGRVGFCGNCRSQLRPAIVHECPHCGAPVGPFTDLTHGCGQCRREQFAFERLIRLGVYQDEMRTACLRAKANGGSGMARSLTDALVEQHRDFLVDSQFDCVIPIPEHWTRRFLHPHYAAEIISRQVARMLGIAWDNSNLFKQNRTPKQATSPIQQRRTQQQGSFAVKRPDKIAGKSLLIVDDILTTGSTANAAARALKQSGASRIVVAVLAVSPLRQ